MANIILLCVCVCNPQSLFCLVPDHNLLVMSYDLWFITKVKNNIQM